MVVLLALGALAGLIPLFWAWTRLRPAATRGVHWPPLGSILLATLCFNIVFLWQELWLALPKAFVPGLTVTLFHNDHDWTGDAPIAELLEGTGAVANLILGFFATELLRRLRHASPMMRLVLFWIAFNGLFQALSQFLIGTALPGNDVGRALRFLDAGRLLRPVLGCLTIAGMFAAGRVLAVLAPLGLTAGGEPGSRSFGTALFVTTASVVVLSVPFREPRNPVEVLVIPAFVGLIGLAWLLVGTAVVARNSTTEQSYAPATIGPAVAVVALLALFQLLLRPGVSI